MPSNQTTCTQDIADNVLSGLSQGNSLSQVCRDLKLKYNTVYHWMEVHKETFFKNSPRAYKAGYDALADECIDIADESGADVSVDDKGKYNVDGEVIQRSRLRIDTRLRLLGKWSNKYADKNIHTGADGEGPVEIKAITRTIINPDNTTKD